MSYPYRFAPVYFEKVWGGRRLEEVLGRCLPPGELVGESWEISDHPHGESVVMNGVDRGLTLHELIERDGEDLLGRRARGAGRFPLLIKYIDAQDKLSVQVHPDDAYGFAHEGEPGKTEMWYILHAEEGARLIAGLRAGVTAEEFTAALNSGDPAALLHEISVKSGDAVFIPAGRIHAIMPGLLILEIQQNSDTTYRLYDWGRMGLDGKPRELHVEKAMAVTNWGDAEPTVESPEMRKVGENRIFSLVKCPYFQVEKVELAEEFALEMTGESFVALNCVGGEALIQWAGGVERVMYGDSLLLPAALRGVTLLPGGRAECVIVRN